MGKETGNQDNQNAQKTTATETQDELFNPAPVFAPAAAIRYERQTLLDIAKAARRMPNPLLGRTDLIGIANIGPRAKL
jgi:hypothetical protein